MIGNLGKSAGLGSSSGGVALTNFFAGIFGGGGFGSGDSFGNQDLGQFLHSGGLAGAAGGDWRSVHPAAWADAPRLHMGGIAGDEVPAVLRRGEEALTRSDPRHRNNGGGGGSNVVVNQTFNTQGQIDSRTRLQFAADAQVALGRARRNL